MTTANKKIACTGILQGIKKVSIAHLFCGFGSFGI